MNKNNNEDTGLILGFIIGIVTAIIVWGIFIAFHHWFIGLIVAFFAGMAAWLLSADAIKSSMNKEEKKIAEKEAEEKWLERQKREEQIKETALIYSHQFESNTIVDQIAKDIYKEVLPISSHIKSKHYSVHIDAKEVELRDEDERKRKEEIEKVHGYCYSYYCIKEHLKTWNFYNDFYMKDLPNADYVNGFGCCLKRKLEVLLSSSVKDEISICYFDSSCSIRIIIPNPEYIAPIEPKEWS